jgi:hypothetical protein
MQIVTAEWSAFTTPFPETRPARRFYPSTLDSLSQRSGNEQFQYVPGRGYVFNLNRTPNQKAKQRQKIKGVFQMKNLISQINRPSRFAVSALSLFLLAGQFVLAQTSRLGSTLGVRGKSERAKQMADETASYLEKARVPIKANKGQYFSDDKAETYLLSSTEKLNVSAPKSAATKVVAVIDYQSGGRSAFYVIEAQTDGDSITYSLKREGRAIKTFTTKVQRPNLTKGPGVDACDDIAKQNAQTRAALRAYANQTCKRASTCIGVCNPDAAHIAWEIIYFDPTSIRCQRYNAPSLSIDSLAWLTLEDDSNHGTLFDSTVWMAIKNDSSLFF